MTMEAIQRRLFLLACNGVSDTDKLRERLLRSFAGTRRSRVSQELTILSPLQRVAYGALCMTIDVDKPKAPEQRLSL